MEDIFEELVTDNLAWYDSATAELIVNRWPSQEELDAVVAADSARYERVLERAGLSTDSAGSLQTIPRRCAGGWSSRTWPRLCMPTGRRCARRSGARSRQLAKRGTMRCLALARAHPTRATLLVR